MRLKQFVLFIIMYFGITLYLVAQRSSSTLLLPEIPDTLMQPKSRAAYLLEHYWDNVNLDNPDVFHDAGFMEQSLVDYFNIFDHADSVAVKIGISKLWDKCLGKQEIWDIIMEISEKYLYDIESPMFNDAYFGFILGEILKHSPNDTRAEFMYKECMRNRKGSIGADFDFICVDEQNLQLYSSCILGEKILIFFDPECDHCRQLLSWLKSDQRVSALIDKGKLSIVTIYVLDDIDQWKDYASTLPKSWYNGYSPDGQVDTDGVYGLRATPSVYWLSIDNIIKGKYLGAVDLDELLNQL